MMPSGKEIDVNEEHQLNACLPIVVTPFGIIIEDKRLHPENAPSSISIRVSGVLTVVSSRQELNAFFPILVTPFEIVTDFKEQLLKADSLISLTLPGMVTEDSLVLAKADFPITVTESGIETDAKSEQFSKAESLIVVTPSGIVISESLVHPLKASSAIVLVSGWIDTDVIEVSTGSIKATYGLFLLPRYLALP